MSEIRDSRVMKFDCESNGETFTLVMNSGRPFGHQEELRVNLSPDEVDRMASKIDAWREGRKMVRTGIE